MSAESNALIEKLRAIAPQPDRGDAHTNISTMLAAQAKAAVEARFIMALNRPRNWDDVRINLLAECRRPAFAQNKSAYYIKPIGKGVEGLGIRFAEVALRCMSNVLVETTTLHDDSLTRMLNVSVTDLEANETFNKTITVTKTVERSKPLDDGTFLSMRKNSKGEKTYTVPATDDDLLNKEGALVSKAVRVLALRIIPGDLQDECEAIIKAVRANTASKDPAGERKKIADGFAEINVMPSDLSEYLGHDFGGCSPAELVKLRGLYGAIRDGETTWAAIIEQAATEAQEAQAKKLREAMKQPKPKAAAAPPPEPDHTPAAGVPPEEIGEDDEAPTEDVPGNIGADEPPPASATRKRVTPPAGMLIE